MDGAIAASSAETVRRTSVRFPAGAFSPQPSLADGSSMHAGLFEQFLNFATPETTHPIEPSTDSNHALPAQTEEDASESDNTEAASNVEQAESSQPTAEEEAEQGAVEDQVAILSVSAAVNSTAAPAEEESVEQQVEQPTAVDKQLTAEQGENNENRSGESLISENAPPTIADSNENVENAQSLADLPVISATEVSNSARDTGNNPLNQQATENHPDDQQIQFVNEHLQSAESLETAEAAIEEEVAQLNLLDTQQAPLPADSREPAGDRGEKRSKWYKRDSELTSITQATEESPDISQAEAADETHPSDRRAENQPTTEARPLQPHSPPAAIENTVAVANSAIPIVEVVASKLVGSQPLLSDAGANSGGDATASTNGVDNSKPTAKNNSPDAKGAAAPAQRSDELTQAERVRLVQRVSRSFARLGPTGGQVNIRLHPPQLGSLSIQVRMEGRTMTAKLSTESEAARDAIVESLPVLRGRLAEQGFEISSFQVEVAEYNPDVTDNSQQSWSNQTDGSENNSNRQVDHRRLAAQQRQTLTAVGRQSGSAETPQLAWQAMAGIDLQA